MAPHFAMTGVGISPHEPPSARTLSTKERVAELPFCRFFRADRDDSLPWAAGVSARAAFRNSWPLDRRLLTCASGDLRKT
jgi:hypothetical protein